MTISKNTTETAPYRDPAVPLEDRVSDLLDRMTVEEKAGLMFQHMIVVGPDGELAGPVPGTTIPGTVEAVDALHMTHFNLLGPAPEPRELAAWHNRLQERAAATRLGIPVTLSTDPRHHFTENLGTASAAGSFSQWPETLGLAALRDADLVERFADIARQEYLAVGLRAALHPQIDLSTEYRWSRISGTFGEDADLTGELVAAYIRGFQGTELGSESVSTMTKHFPGGGPQKDGEDPHFPYGREQVYPAGRFEYHLAPFRKALAAGASQIMPYYGMPIDTELEEVAFAFNRQVITGLLREELGFDGIVCTDWGLITDGLLFGEPAVARAWGVEHLDELTRVQRIIEAGCDQFGGESRPELVVELVRTGRVDEARIDVSVRRLLREKFRLGLFEDPYVDVDRAAEVVGRADFVAAGDAAQRAALTVLRNDDAVLPLAGRRIWVEGLDASTVTGAQVVGDLADADVAVIRLRAPYDERPGRFESMFHAGSLDFPDERIAHVREVAAQVPTVVVVYLDRPAVLTPLDEVAAAVVVEFGASDAAITDVLTGVAEARGALPFDLPRSTAAVVASPSDAPFSTADPLYRFGDGLRA
ncbi:glycoside hydrolase family 3 protein [Curtobacterium sp. PhB115]|uniref:glycoside hydrolase family 3 protein n=1 Tax=Curtobacterium sp. PhB115 TaxID=2485173 RepID=UPI000F4B0EFC|nr:glycoside hydrolase family 3 N-terminal domain-containing protein [Curtobacterium sp. PhB115]ROP74047.1 beta-glucosidase [Curtobacterium sp. PhB115]